MKGFVVPVHAAPRQPKPLLSPYPQAFQKGRHPGLQELLHLSLCLEGGERERGEAATLTEGPALGPHPSQVGVGPGQANGSFRGNAKAEAGKESTNPCGWLV